LSVFLLAEPTIIYIETKRNPPENTLKRIVLTV